MIINNIRYDTKVVECIIISGSINRIPLISRGKHYLQLGEIENIDRWYNYSQYFNK